MGLMSSFDLILSPGNSSYSLVRYHFLQGCSFFSETRPLYLSPWSQKVAIISDFTDMSLNKFTFMFLSADISKGFLCRTCLLFEIGFPLCFRNSERIVLILSSIFWCKFI